MSSQASVGGPRTDPSSPGGRPTEHDPVDPAARSYYGRPVVKEPEWTWEVPWYLFAGGLAGASSVLAAGASLTGNTVLARRARLIATAGATVSPPLLIADLGRPARFLNMLRVFKPTSVMSMGSWTLAAYSGAAFGSAGLDLLGRLPRMRAVADAAAGVFGVGMSTYTGALLADTSIPVWHEARRHLPAYFASSSLASAGAAATLVTPTRYAGPARRAAVTGAVAELTIDVMMRRDLGAIGEVYEQQRSGRFHKAATIATSAGAALLAAGRGRWRTPTVVGAAAILVGSVCQRWSAYDAGFQSARDPLAVSRPQRDRLERGEGHRQPDGDPLRHRTDGRDAPGDRAGHHDGGGHGSDPAATTSRPASTGLRSPVEDRTGDDDADG